MPRTPVVTTHAALVRGAAALTWTAACGAGALGAALSVGWHLHAKHDLERVQGQWAASSPPERSRPLLPLAPSDSPDFAHSLPETAAMDAIVQDLQRLHGTGGAAVVSMDGAIRPATPASLGRLELAVLLRGDYGKVKAALADLLDRHPTLRMQRLSLRRSGSPTELEANVGMSLLTRPADVPAVGR